MSHHLACAARDLLHALDAGIIGDGHKFPSGGESAFVRDLRAALDAYNREQIEHGDVPALPFPLHTASIKGEKNV